MESTLLSISKIFTERIFRIPDYQRGYAWTEKQLKDFWNDLYQLEENRNHYVGVLTLEIVPENIVTRWEDDLWIIQSKNYTPFYIVDGQQRLTTTIILIQSIIDQLHEESAKLNYTSRTNIRDKFIFESKDGGISRSYLFGYEKDNPSYEYLKTKIFREEKDKDFRLEETIYTNNLEFSKKYFSEKLEKLKIKEIESLYKKITQNFLFNIYTISCDIDVFVTFETMNNRGKPLSVLELLKNRLIYLSTRLKTDQHEKNRLRKSVNDCWKSIYHALGKNKENPLDDDGFLRTHCSLYFGNEIFGEENEEEPIEISFRSYRKYHYNYSFFESYLLEEKFTIKSINEDKLSILQINKYVNNLQESVEIWYNMFNPSSSNLDDDEVVWLEKLDRINIVNGATRTNNKILILSILQNEPNKKTRIEISRKIERLIFITVWSSNSYLFRLENQITSLAIQFKEKKIKSEKLIKEIEDLSHKLIEHKEIQADTKKRFKQSGFYDWPGIRYLLFEYEQHLKSISKTHQQKIDWKTFNEEKKDYITIEHIYPQTTRDKAWTEIYRDYSFKDRKILRNSLGNLLPLSKPKNSSLQNKPFLEKIGISDTKVGYRYGSFSENEVTECLEWTSAEILERGLRLLGFIEKNWNIKLGDKKDKIEFLGLDFLLTNNNSKV